MDSCEMEETLPTAEGLTWLESNYTHLEDRIILYPARREPWSPLYDSVLIPIHPMGMTDNDTQGECCHWDGHLAREWDINNPSINAGFWMGPGVKVTHFDKEEPTNWGVIPVSDAPGYASLTCTIWNYDANDNDYGPCPYNEGEGDTIATTIEFIDLCFDENCTIDPVLPVDNIVMDVLPESGWPIPWWEHNGQNYKYDWKWGFGWNKHVYTNHPVLLYAQVLDVDPTFCGSNFLVETWGNRGDSENHQIQMLKEFYQVGVEKIQLYLDGCWIDINDPDVYLNLGISYRFRAVRRPSSVPWPPDNPVWSGVANGVGEEMIITINQCGEFEETVCCGLSCRNMNLIVECEPDIQEIRCRCGCSAGPMMQGSSYPINNQGMIGNQVKLATGEKQEQATELAIEGRGLDFSWERSYRSGREYASAIGNKWDFSYNRYIERGQDEQYIWVNFGDGYKIRFKKYYEASVNGWFRETNKWWARGEFEQLEKDNNNDFYLRFPGGEVWKFRGFLDSMAPGKIDYASDANGNSIKFYYEQGDVPFGGGTGWRLNYIKDSLNRIIGVDYDASGYISSISDPTGRTVTYEHYGTSEPDGNAGDLKSVISPLVSGTVTGNNFPNGQKITYTYHKGVVGENSYPELKHNLLTITDARRNDPNDPLFEGNPNFTYEYGEDPNDSDSFARVLRQESEEGIIDIYYQGIEDDGVKTITNDNVGNVCEALFDKTQNMTMIKTFNGRADPSLPTTLNQNRPQNPLHPEAPDYFETEYSYNSDYRLKKAVFSDNS